MEIIARAKVRPRHRPLPLDVCPPARPRAAALPVQDKRWKSIHFYCVEDSRADRGREGDGRAGGGGGDEILSTPRYEAKIPFQWVFHLSPL